MWYRFEFFEILKYRCHKINLQRDREKVTARQNEGHTKIGLFATKTNHITQ
jgi:hypothetical protein